MSTDGNGEQSGPNPPPHPDPRQQSQTDDPNPSETRERDPIRTEDPDPRRTGVPDAGAGTRMNEPVGVDVQLIAQIVAATIQQTSRPSSSSRYVKASDLPTFKGFSLDGAEAISLSTHSKLNSLLLTPTRTKKLSTCRWLFQSEPPLTPGFGSKGISVYFEHELIRLTSVVTQRSNSCFSSDFQRQ